MCLSKTVYEIYSNANVDIFDVKYNIIGDNFFLIFKESTIT